MERKIISAKNHISQKFPEIIEYILGRIGYDHSLKSQIEKLEDIISRRMAELKLENSKKYLDICRSSSAEMQKVLKDLTVGISHFFRNIRSWEYFYESILPQMLREKAARKDLSLNIWSAGCSTGAEVYSAAILIRDQVETFYKDRHWQISIAGSDINESFLHKAQRGKFQKEIIEGFSAAQENERFKTLFLKYFVCKGKYYHPRKNIKENISFKYINLNDIPQDRFAERELDLIFFYQVGRYLEAEVVKKILLYFSKVIKKEGYLFIDANIYLKRFIVPYKKPVADFPNSKILQIK